jgi:flagellar assembly protein FliH
MPPAGGAKGSSAYTRFIPREELGSYSTWKPDAFGTPGGVERRAEPRPADGTLPTVEQWRAKIHAARQAGYQEGYRDGMAGLEGFKQGYAAQMSAQFGGLVESFEAALAQQEQAIAQAIANAATQLARRVVRGELQARPALVAEVAREAVDAVLMSARQIVVRVHPEDLPFVAQGAAEALQARGARLVADPALTRGGCTIESDAGSIDVTIENRWSRAAAAVGGDARWEGA